VTYPHLLQIPGFQQLIFVNRNKGRGGGVGFYIRNGLNFKTVDLKIRSHDKILEHFTLEISYTNDKSSKHYLVTNIYRSPSHCHGMTNTQHVENFLDNMDRILNKLNTMNHDSYIFLDSNINLLTNNNDNLQSKYLTSILDNGFLLTNFRATRIQNGSSSLIDHILTNSKTNCFVSGSIIEDISDHFVTFLQPNLTKTKSKPTSIKRRSYTTDKLNSFKRHLGQLSWEDVLVTDNVDDCYDKFWNHYKLLHDQHFPITTCKFNKNIHKISDFMTQGLLVSRQTKINLHKTAITHNTMTNWNKYRTFRNLFNKTVRASKKLYFDKQLKTNIKNPKKTWDILKELTTGKNDKQQIDKIKVDDRLITDPQVIAEEFNSFFAEAGKKIYNSVTPISKQYSEFVPETTPPKLSFYRVSEAVVVNIINGMDPKISMDAQELNMKMIKFIKFELVKPLTHLFNLSISTGAFPSKLKISRTVPIFKAGDCTSCDNYRPISLLSSISKILEKIIATSLTNHLELNKLINENQYGFLRGRSTVHSLTKVTNRIAKDLNDKKFVVGLFLDLRKAFDVVSHDILIDKLQRLGIKDKELDWFISYLDNRQQFVDINGHISTKRLIDISVLQGSILGPILFLCFINDLPAATNLMTVLFADDTLGLDSDKDLAALLERTNTEIQKLANWFRANRMAVNVGKTKYIIFRNKGTKINIDLERHGLVYNCNEIGQPDNPDLIYKLGRIYNDNPEKTERAYKFLGIYLDEYLTFDTHCTHICNKLAMSNFIINRAKNFLSPHTLRTLYFALIHPHLLYGLPIYSCTSQKNINKLFLAQKKAIRTITNSNRNSHTAPLFIKQNILPLQHLITYTKGLLVHSIFHKYSPASLHDTWTTVANHNPDHALRNDNDYYMPFARTDNLMRLTYYSLPSVWNNLPDNRLTPNPTTFKIALKNHLHRTMTESHV
jgi:hypothetical protein